MTDSKTAASGGKAPRTPGQGHALAGLTYPFENHPKGAETFEVAPGILWARIPLPFRLNHVNVWLLRERDGWAVVDTGTANAEARKIWDTLLGTVLADAPIVRLIATHGHTDHIGLAGWLHELSGGAPYHITLVEWLSATVRIDESRSPIGPHALKFMTAHGCDEETVESFREERRRTNAQMVPMPTAIERLRDGQTVRFGDRDWTIMVCGGHAAEHASFWCEEDRILIAGDQILSKISPMVGVFPGEPLSDPLSDYLTSLEEFRKLPADTYVLPSHGLPFYGLHKRIDQLAAHHAVRLETLVGLMDRPTIAMELTSGLFAKAVKEGQGRNALAETLAHAHRLVTEGRARRIERKDRVLFERATPEARG